MDIIKQLAKQQIDVKIDENTLTFTFPDQISKKCSVSELENYLLMCLLNYIKL